MGILYGPAGEDGTRTPIPALSTSADQVIVPNSNGQSVTEALAGKAAATHTHTLDNLDGTLSLSKGGTGATTAEGVFNSLGIADYVVETGNTGIWYYRKWNSGYAECWGNMSTHSSTNPVDLPFTLPWGLGWAGLTTYNNTTAQAFLSVTVTTSTAELTGYDTSGKPVNEFHARVYIFGVLQQKEEI